MCTTVPTGPEVGPIVMRSWPLPCSTCLPVGELVVAGDPEAASRLTQRPAIERTEMGVAEVHPVEAAYDEFKSRIRQAYSSADRAV